MSLAGFKIIDADGHVTEPASLYSTHIDPKFRAAADALLSRVGAGNLGIVPALYPKWRTAERPLGEANEVPGLGKLPSGRNHPLASPAGGYDPDERIRDMDKEGIDVAVCFPTIHISIRSIEARRTPTCRSVFTAAPIARRSRPAATTSATICS